MIQADTRELETKLRQTVIGIRQKEVSLFTDQFAVLASSATFMSSLGFGALNMEIGFLEKENGEYCSELVGCGRWRVLLPLVLFYSFAAAGTAFNLLAVILASFGMIFGPELAIRGTEASMGHAVVGMYEERREALRYFWVGCLFIVLSGIALGWMKFPTLTAGIITLVFISLLVFCAVYVLRLRPLFAYVDSDNLAELQYSVSQPVDNRPSADSTYNRHSQGSAHGGDGGGGGSARRQSTLERLVAATSRTSSPASYGALRSSSGERTSEAPPWEHFASRDKSGNLFVDGMLRYAVYAERRLRLFSLDGRELASFAQSEIRACAQSFVLGGKGVKERNCTGTTARETERWIATINDRDAPGSGGAA